MEPNSIHGYKKERLIKGKKGKGGKGIAEATIRFTIASRNFDRRDILAGRKSSIDRFSSIRAEFNFPVQSVLRYPYETLYIFAYNSRHE